MIVTERSHLQQVVSPKKLILSLGLGAALVVLLVVAPPVVQTAVFTAVGVIALWELLRSIWRRQCTTRAFVLLAVMMTVVVVGMIGTLLVASSPGGAVRTLAIACVVVATDAGAQIIGRRYGEAGTFFPALSPNKSRVGAAGGMVTGLLVAGLASILVSFSWPVLLAAPFVAMAGDLLESATKRELGVKDFATYLADTGGILDRIDSWLPVMALVGLTAI